MPSPAFHCGATALFALLLSATQCSTQPLPPISGNIHLEEGWKPTVYLVQPRRFAEIAANYSGLVIDSASIAADGNFVFSRLLLPDTPTLFQLCIQKEGSRFPNQLLDDEPPLANYMPVILQKGERLVVSADAGRFQATFSIQNPSAENRALLQLRGIRHEAFRLLQPVATGEAHAEEDSQLLEREAALQQFRAPLMAFADSTSHLLPALVAIRWVSPDGDYERVPEFIVGQCQKWLGKYSENPWTRQLCDAGSREKLPVLTGDAIPDYPLPMSTGDTVLLYGLLGNRLTILDIWASWCAPCRRENREVLAPLWSAYREKGLQILGYSIDSSPAAWKAAVTKDGAVWPHASHLSGDATPFLDSLRVTTIPANFILDAGGKVVAKNLHGDSLKRFVVAYLR